MFHFIFSTNHIPQKIFSTNKIKMKNEIIYTGNLLRYLEPQKNIQDEFEHSISESLELDNWHSIVEEDQFEKNKKKNFLTS